MEKDGQCIQSHNKKLVFCHAKDTFVEEKGSITFGAMGTGADCIVNRWSFGTTMIDLFSERGFRWKQF